MWGGVWQDTDGKVWNGSAWVDAWKADKNIYILNGANLGDGITLNSRNNATLTSSGYRINRFGSETERELWINKPSFMSSQYNLNIEGTWSGSTAETVGIAIQFYNETTYINGFNGMLYPLNSASFSFSGKSVDTANNFCVVIWYSTSPSSGTVYLTIKKLWLSPV